MGLDPEDTNPNIQAPVTYGYCKRNTDRIMTVLTRVDKNLDAHTAWHDGVKEQAKDSIVKGQFWIRIVLVLIAIGALVGGTVWAVSEATHAAVRSAVDDR
jgi:hypothetical protein